MAGGVRTEEHRPGHLTRFRLVGCFRFCFAGKEGMMLAAVHGHGLDLQIH